MLSELCRGSSAVDDYIIIHIEYSFIKLIVTICISYITVHDVALRNRIEQSNVYRLVSAYREHGHKKAATDPLKLKSPA